MVLALVEYIKVDHNDKQRLKNLIKNEFVPLKINKRVISAFLKVPREEFVLPVYRREAYFDNALPIGFQQTISQPSLVAVMTQALELKGNEKVLEVGTGSGYQAAILSRLAKEVYTVERIEGLAKRAKEILEKLNYKNIKVIIGDGSRGVQEFAPFDAIMVTAGALEIPKALIDQLKENGRIVIPVGINLYSQELLLGKKKNEKMEYKILGEVRFVPLIKA